ncbi:MAG: bifunctional diaminohydroxyphosphoribosylaminopyrimidine deaminase/5-amino-6-(5-phosphoribosylamino)uracil reductase RibD [Firmicutes bacterium]|nr:bifunctional diaminohydroxyphosphoribosylaminopyrimidine deaminase/5-amino-6-(5-phosphoribosylamino)uracil reductase RibD [Bacillota bacterium]
MDMYYMEMALQLASRASGRTSPNPMVGAVLVRDGEVVGQGFHARAGAPHAEIMALKDAGDKAKKATLYVTLEPCCHFGRTGPCTEAVIAAGVKRVVVATTDPNPLVAGKGINRLREAGLEVLSGIMEEESLHLNEVFNKYITTKLPFVVAKAAMSLDGKIATRTGDSQWITGNESLEQAHRLRDRYDSILVGIGTVLSDNPSLTTRLPGKEGRDPVRIILDSYARTPPQCKMLTQNSFATTYIIVSKDAQRESLKRLEAAGARIVILNNDSDGIDVDELLRWLGEQQISSILVEGGSSIHGSFFARGIVDKVAWFVAPKIIGGREAPGPVGGKGVEVLENAVLLDRMQVSMCGRDMLIEGYIKKS